MINPLCFTKTYIPNKIFLHKVALIQLSKDDIALKQLIMYVN